MNYFDEDKEYEPFKIPNKQKEQQPAASKSMPEKKLNNNEFYVIDYDLSSIKGVGKFVLKPQKIEPPKRDEIRDLFSSMRELARQIRPFYFGNNNFYDQSSRRTNSIIFYKQGKLMQDFDDDYSQSVDFKSYFPYYQMMSYEQLRTYFTWRTKTRKGEVENTSLSYAFLYIYELINHIGVKNKQDGLDKLIAFWRSFREYDNSIDKYVLRWIQDYYIYYNFEQPFKAFVEENGLQQFFPNIAKPDNDFDLFCSISKYDIRKSHFFNEKNSALVAACFNFVMKTLRQALLTHSINLDKELFYTTKKRVFWLPFNGALFHNWINQADRQIILSDKEIYICDKNQWFFNSSIATNNSRQLIGYIMKKTEATLRQLTNFKYKLTANINGFSHFITDEMQRLGLSLEKIVDDAVITFYKEATKTVVKVDFSSLSKIREEALTTQEKLIVEEQEDIFTPPAAKEEEPPSYSDEAEVVFTINEINALKVLLLGGDIKSFADESEIMLEVLMDSINEKAMDLIGDSFMDENFEIYEEYSQQIKDMVNEYGQ